MTSRKPGLTRFERMLRRAAGQPTNRRTLLKGAIGASTAAILSGAKTGLGYDIAGAQQMARIDGVTLNIFTQTGPFISGPVKFHAPEFNKLTGATVNAIEAPNADLFARAQQVAQSGSGDFDILLLANTWMPDFVNLGYAVPLQPWIDKDVEAKDPLLAWDDIPDGIKRKDSWAGKINTFIVDNDNQSMFYRKDVLADPKWQEAYKTATGKDLPNPPQTLPELIDVATFFSPNGAGKDWSDQGASYGFITCVLRGAQSYWYSYPWTAPYSVLPTDKAPEKTAGIYIFDPDMNPLINTEGYVRGLTEFVQIINQAMKPGLDADRTTVIDDMVNGTTMFSLDWGDTGPASVSDQSVVKGKLGFSMTPGVTEYYDWVNKTWVTMPEGQIHKTPTHAYNGWSYYITNQTKNPDAAWEWIKWVGSPDISAVDVASPDSGYQPWRKSHSTNLQPWVAAGWDEAEAKKYIDVILANTDDPNAVFDPRIPGAARYQDTLELYTNQAIAGELKPQEAMDKCVADFNKITDELGRDKQIAAYHAHLGMK
ncbi:MAG TPA: extracellular solute-binding protein [Thermomicrobiales bacterium]|nr:extracellular solute-binding protein [Thermomicrobiales bacterium]